MWGFRIPPAAERKGVHLTTKQGGYLCAMPVLLTTACLPPLYWWALALQRQQCLIETQEHFQKGSFRNRYVIATSQGPLLLSIPLGTGKNKQCPITQVMISPGNWTRQHWKSIQTAYRPSPFWEEYESGLSILFEKMPQYLLEWNTRLLDWAMHSMGVSISWKSTSEWKLVYPEEVLDARKDALVFNNWTNTGTFPTYHQVFSDRNGFNPNVSILDLIFCKGPEALSYLRALGSWTVQANQV